MLRSRLINQFGKFQEYYWKTSLLKLSAIPFTGILFNLVTKIFAIWTHSHILLCIIDLSKGKTQNLTRLLRKPPVTGCSINSSVIGPTGTVTWTIPDVVESGIMALIELSDQKTGTALTPSIIILLLSLLFSLKKAPLNRTWFSTLKTQGGDYWYGSVLIGVKPLQNKITYLITSAALTSNTVSTKWKPDKLMYFVVLIQCLRKFRRLFWFDNTIQSTM